RTTIGNYLTANPYSDDFSISAGREFQTLLLFLCYDKQEQKSSVSNRNRADMKKIITLRGGLFGITKTNSSVSKQNQNYRSRIVKISGTLLNGKDREKRSYLRSLYYI
ncbi:hypothetical protein PV325_010029, partial [Microctonus aethiopoides]